MSRSENETFVKKRRFDGDDEKKEAVYTDGHQPASNMTKKYGIGAKLLSKMGYKQGQGLGRDGSGISVPIEPEKRPVASAGLGSLSAAVNEESDSSSDSDDELSITKASGAVKFQKNAAETLDIGVTEDNAELKELAKNLQLHCDVEVSENNLDKLNPASKHDLEGLVQELLEIESELKNLERRTPLIEPELFDVEDEMSILQAIELNQDKTDFNSFKLKTELILSLRDNDLIDQLFAEMLQRTISPALSQWDPFSESNEMLTKLLSLVNMLKYRMDDASTELNCTQTVLFHLVVEKLELHLQDFTLNKDQMNTVITLFLDLKPILKFTGCEDYLLQKYIYPKLLEALDKWRICEDNAFPPRMWYFDFSVIIDQAARYKIEESTEIKLVQYCDGWYHRTSSVIKPADLIFIQEVLGQQKYCQIVKEKFLPKFIDQLWDKYFDPVIDLEDDCGEDGSFYYYKKLRQYRLLFHQNDYKIMVSAIFNELNKILYQWLLYADDEDLIGARWWFNWFVDKMFAIEDPIEVEVAEIRRTLSFFHNTNALEHPLHQDAFDLKIALNLSDSREEYDIRSIPLRKVEPTFKNVVEDFCEEKGYVLEKSDAYTQRLYGTSQDTLVPIFKMYGGGASHNVAIKDDILWVERDGGEFFPVYLYELVP